MRVIAGEKKGLLLSTPKGLHTRPTNDRIKETLFNIISFDLPDASFLDLFSGSGQMGIEALSRGASKAVFIDNDKAACKCINDNLIKTGYKDRSDLHDQDVISFLKTYSGKGFDIIFIDPPYHENLEDKIIEALSESNAVTDHTVIILEADKNTIFSDKLPGNIYITREKVYKTNKHIFMGKGIKS
ncbi:MAG: 16S rRNA (guanine(966)-N(2))-methyltransferase RsmD [Lachnospiraceae bacterium]|nr:16S rRNA (guanine(966)-N(2))-methyltransferase RsmD [Lachnospiraceae bacterium]